MVCDLEFVWHCLLRNCCLLGWFGWLGLGGGCWLFVLGLLVVVRLVGGLVGLVG